MAAQEVEIVEQDGTVHGVGWVCTTSGRMVPVLADDWEHAERMVEWLRERGEDVRGAECGMLEEARSATGGQATSDAIHAATQSALTRGHDD